MKCLLIDKNGIFSNLKWLETAPKKIKLHKILELGGYHTLT